MLLQNACSVKKGGVFMNLNEVLTNSQEKTQLAKIVDNSFMGIVVKYTTNFEGFILKNRSKEVKPIDKLASFIFEILVNLALSYFISILVMVFGISIRVTFKFAENYNPYDIVPFNQLLLVISICIFLVVIFLQNRKSDMNTFTIIKTAVYVCREMNVSKNKILHYFGEILIIFLLWITFSGSMFYIGLQLFPIYNYADNLMLYVTIGAVSFVITYIIKVELEPDELKKIQKKSIFVIASFLVSIFLGFYDFQKYNKVDSVWIVKLISILLLCVFQFNNIITIVKDIYKFIEDSLEKRTDLFVNEIEISNEKRKAIQTTLTGNYIFIPNKSIKTFSEYFYTFKRILRIVIKRNKINKGKRRQTIILMISSIILLIYFISFNNIELNLNNTSKSILQLIYIALFVLGGFLMLSFMIAFLEKKSVFRVIIDEFNSYINKVLPHKDEVINIDKFGLTTIKSYVKPYLFKFFLANTLVFVLVVLSKLLFILDIIDSRKFILVISVLLIPAFSYLTKKEFNIFIRVLNSYIPRHLKYKVYKMIIRISVIILFICSFGLNLVYIMILK